MDHQEFLIPFRHVPGGDGRAGYGSLGHLAQGQGRVGIAQAAPGLVDVQHGPFSGIFCRYGHVVREHAAVYLSAQGGRCQGTAARPADGSAHVFVATVFGPPVAQLFTLVHKWFAGAAEEDGRRLLLPGHILVHLRGETVLVVVGEEEGGDGIRTLGRMVAHIGRHGTHEAGGVSAVEHVAYLISIVEFEAGSEGLVVGLLHAVTFPSLGHHEDIAVVAGLLIGGVAVLVPFGKEGAVGRMVVGIEAAADMFHGIQAQAVHAHPDPLVGRCRHILEAGVVLGLGHIPVIEVRHPVAEAAHIIKGLGRDVGELDLVAAVAGEPHVGAVSHQFHLLAFRDVAAVLGAELGTGIPVVVLAHQHAPLTGDVHHQVIGAVSLVHELDELPFAAVLPGPEVPDGRTVGNILGGLRHLDMGRTAGDRLPLARGITGSREHGEVLIVGGRIGADEIVVPVGAGGIGDSILEPGMALAAVVEHIIQVNLDTLFMCLGQQFLEIVHGAQLGMDTEIIGDIIAVVGIGRMDGAQPQGRHAQFIQIVQVLGNALDVAPAVSVAVGEGVHQQLVGRIGAFGAVEGGRRGNQLGQFLSLGYRHGLALRAGLHRNHGTAAVARVIVLHAHGERSVPLPGGLAQDHPAVGYGGRPVGRCRHRHELVAGVLVLEDEGRRRKAEGYLLVGLLVSGAAGKEHGAGEQHQIIFQLFHIRRLKLADGCPVRGARPKKTSCWQG